ncbi:radical SAM protein, partial [Microcoleus sp. Pol12B4]
MYLKYEDIRRVSVEITSRCNAACPQCPRTGNPILPGAELKMEDIERIFPQEFCSQLDLVYMCGNYGDAMTSNT